MSLIDADTGEIVDRTPALRTSGPMTTIRADHVQAAQRKLDTYDENIEVLRPHMESFFFGEQQAIPNYVAPKQ